MITTRLPSNGNLANMAVRDFRLHYLSHLGGPYEPLDAMVLRALGSCHTAIVASSLLAGRCWLIVANLTVARVAY
jgi:hypothetical protein